MVADRRDALLQLWWIRLARWLTYGPFFAALPITLLAIVAPEEWHASVWPLTQTVIVAAFLGFLASFVVDRARCPRCGRRLFFGAPDHGPTANPFSSKCLHCGLRLDGANIEEPYGSP